ncbi:MAG: class I SAM-dependent methyltransferase [Spirochaetales bacterium]|nr:class I SAM-dependent methyltransferase [Spirochaetales bacterium]
MEKKRELEFYYASRLRESNAAERKKLYHEAYSVVSNFRTKRTANDDPVKRTAGTSKRVVQILSGMVNKHENVLEVGCGRGYTCLKLAPYVKSMAGVDVSEPAITEAKELLAQYKIKNVRIMQVSAFELIDYFSENEFDTCISIDVVEHLHPEDAKEHLQQVLHILKPGGKYIVIMPNRISGPHDITQKEFPGVKEALGFHLNESTYKEMIHIMRVIGFNNFKLIGKKILPQKELRPLILPGRLGIVFETVCKSFPFLFKYNIFKKLVNIKLIAYKPVK